jgi:hypothetical protein
LIYRIVYFSVVSPSPPATEGPKEVPQTKVGLRQASSTYLSSAAFTTPSLLSVHDNQLILQVLQIQLQVATSKHNNQSRPQTTRQLPSAQAVAAQPRDARSPSFYHGQCYGHSADPQNVPKEKAIKPKHKWRGQDYNMIDRQHKERKFLHSEYSPEEISCGAFFFNSPDLLGNALICLIGVAARSPTFMERAQTNNRSKHRSGGRTHDLTLAADAQQV